MKVVPCFVDETGALGSPTQSVFGIGCLIVRDVADLADRLQTMSLNFNAKLRERRLAWLRDIEKNQDGMIAIKDVHLLMSSTRHHEYKLTELREHNKNDYIALLDMFFSYPGSDFHCLLVERNAETLRHVNDKAWRLGIRATSVLLKKRMAEPVFVCCDWQTRPKGEKLRLETELCRLEYVAGCMRVTSEMSTFIQIVDLLLGAVAFDWRDARNQVRPSNNSRVKRELVDFVKFRLGMRPSDRFLPAGRRRFRRGSPVLFTAWQPNPLLLKKPRTRYMHGVQSRIGNDRSAHSGLSTPSITATDQESSVLDNHNADQTEAVGTPQ